MTVAVMAATGLAVGGTAAQADSAAISGSVGVGNTNLVVGATRRTMPRTGSIQITYTDGLGLLNSVSLRIGVINNAGTQFTDTKVLGPGTGGLYTLGTGVLSGTVFRLQWRPSVAFVGNNTWGGTLSWG